MTRVSRGAFDRALQGLITLTGEASGSELLNFRNRAAGLDTPFRAAEAAAAALAAGAGTADHIHRARGGQASTIEVDSRHVEASLLSFAHLRFADPERGIPPRVAGEERTAAAGFYPTRDDRWVYLHSGFPHNTAGLLKLLAVKDDRKAVARAVRRWRGFELEEAIGQAGLCGAMVRSADEWDSSPAGSLLASRPVVEIVQMGDSPPEPLPETGDRPLEGTNVLDLTRILAGPTCARTLASYGANVLRVGADHLPTVPLFAIDTGFGKRACHLDLRHQRDAGKLKRLLSKADVFSQGYRSGAMERLGFGVSEVLRARPGMVYVSINCYGHEGAWRPRPGWEQLAQTVTGMAEQQGRYLHKGQPVLLPAAVNDYITGYLAAFGTLVALKRRAEYGGSYWVRVSLARTAVWIRSLGLRRSVAARAFSSREITAASDEIDSAWGRLHYLRPAVSLSGTRVAWKRPPSPLGSDQARF